MILEVVSKRNGESNESYSAYPLQRPLQLVKNGGAYRAQFTDNHASQSQFTTDPYLLQQPIKRQRLMDTVEVITDAR